MPKKSLNRINSHTPENSFNFTEEFSVDVKLLWPGSQIECEATLKIPPQKIPYLAIKDHQSHHALLQSMEQSKNIFDLECRSDTDTYSLYSCDAHKFHIFPKFVVKNVRSRKFTGVEIEIIGLADWFYPPGLLGELPENHELFSTEATIEKRKFAVTGLCYRSAQTNIEEKPRLIATIQIRSLDGAISVADGEVISREVCRFLSLLLSMQLSIKQSWLLTKQTEIRLPFHFWNSANPENPIDGPYSALILPEYIDKSRWDFLFKNYFKGQKAFRKIWPRLIYCFNHVGAWEYDLLGYVGVLDAYLGNFTEKKISKIEKGLFSKLQEDMKALVRRYKEENPEQPGNVFDNLVGGINWLDNADPATFEQKFDYLYLNTDEKIRSIIQFTKAEFTILKQIRNKTAHGLPAPINDPRNISKEFVLRDKLRVYLMYLVYLDFGFTPLDFIRAINSCMAPFRFNADLDRMRLDRAGNFSPFYKVDKTNFELARTLSTQQLYLALNAPTSSEIYSVNVEATRLLLEWFRNLGKGPVVQLNEYLKQKYRVLAEPISTPGYIYRDEDTYLNIHMGIVIIQ